MYQQAENGKTELSLMHFAITNPHWQPPLESSVFIGHLKEKVQQDAANAPPAQQILCDDPICSSFLSNESGTAPDNLLASVLVHPVLTASGLPTRDRRFAQPTTTASAAASVLASLSGSQFSGRHLGANAHSSMYRSDQTLQQESMSQSDSQQKNMSRSSLFASEFASAEMSLHAIYMHEVHQNQGITQRPLGMWQASELSPHQRQQTATRSGSRSGYRGLQLGGWEEEEQLHEVDERSPPQAPSVGPSTSGSNSS